MPKEKITYERVSDHAVKVNYSSVANSTEVVARVVKPGSYEPFDPILSTVQEFKAGSRLTSDIFNRIIYAMEYIAAKHNVPIQPQKKYSVGSKLTASDMNDFVANINKIYAHIGLPIPQWSFEEFRTGGQFTAENMNEIVEAIRKLESLEPIGSKGLAEESGTDRALSVEEQRPTSFLGEKSSDRRKKK